MTSIETEEMAPAEAARLRQTDGYKDAYRAFAEWENTVRPAEAYYHGRPAPPRIPTSPTDQNRDSRIDAYALNATPTWTIGDTVDIDTEFPVPAIPGVRAPGVGEARAKPEKEIER